jgi:hypothetical protein
MLNIIDEFTHECLANRIGRKLRSIDVIDVLSCVFRKFTDTVFGNSRTAISVIPGQGTDGGNTDLRHGADH